MQLVTVRPTVSDNCAYLWGSHRFCVTSPSLRTGLYQLGSYRGPSKSPSGAARTLDYLDGSRP